MRYVPYGPGLDGVPNIVVDGRGNAATVLELSHWPGTSTPQDLKADTSTEIAINYLRSPRRDEYARGAEAVSNNHYDIDGLVSVWAVLNPDEALRRADLLIAVGECGDFERWSGEEATKITCALDGLESDPSSPALEGLPANAGYLEQSAHLYTKMLTLLPEVLENIDAFEPYWRDEYEQVLVDREAFTRGDATVQELPELDLAISHLPRRLHNYALYERTSCTRIALAVEGHRYEARYRYESWVELQSRRPPPRIDLRPFADMLQTFEGNDGEWTADPVDAITPSARLRGPEDGSPSSITPGLFMRLFASFLRDNADDESLLWSPYGAGAAAYEG